MLKKIGLRKFMITTSALVVLGLIYLFPVSTKEDFKQKITYIEEENIHSVFLIDKNEYVSRVNMSLDNEEFVNVLKEKIELLIINGEKQDDIPNGFKPIIPENTKVLDININEDIVTINFSKELLNVEELKEEKMIEAIIFTLTEEKSIKKVIINVEGKKLIELPNSKKKIPEVLDRKYGVNKKYDIDNIYGLTQTTIYYTSEVNDETYYIPVTKISNDNREKITVIVNELKSSLAYQSNLSSYLSTKAELENYEIVEEAMHLTFNDKIFDSLVDKNILEEVEYSISLSVMENYDVEEVVFYVNDEEITTTTSKTLE